MNHNSADANSADTNSDLDPTRCHHRTPSGRRCKMPVVAQGQRLCGMHTAELAKSDGLNLRELLLRNSQGLQTAQGINLALGNIFKLLAANYISARRAAVLTAVCAQLLRTLPAIDADNAAGIADPTALKPTSPEPPSPSAPAAESTDQPGSTPTEPEPPIPSSPRAAAVAATPHAGSLAKQTAPPPLNLAPVEPLW